MTNLWNPRLPGVETAFQLVNKDGHKYEYSGEPWVPNMVESHIQGVAPYSKFLVMTHNNKGYSKGYILVIDTDTGKLVCKMDSPDADYNHPGGCQTIGDFLVVAVENSSYSESFTHFIQPDSAERRQGPTVLPCNIKRPYQGAGGAGISNFTQDGVEYYILAVYDNGKPLTDLEISFSLVHQACTKDGFSEVCLLTQEDGQIFLAGFRSSGSAYEDWADLYLYDPIPLTLECVASRHRYTKHGGVVGISGVHFRWGAGLGIVNGTQLNFFATQRNFVGGHTYTNTFRP